MSSTSHTPPRSTWARRLMTPVARVTHAMGRLLNNGRNDGPPDLDELWRDFNRKLSGMFGGKSGGPSGPSNGGGSPDMRGAGVGVSLIAVVVALGWLASGFFTVQEGQQAVVTSFGKYSKTVGAGWSWRLPYPFQGHEIEPVSQLRQVDVGRSSVVAATGLRDSSMLTQDENIRDLKDFLFENRDPEQAVLLAAESAVREIVGKSTMDSVLYEQRDAIAADLVKSIQAQLDRLKAGIQVKNVNVQSVQPPEQVQAAFDDVQKANANREQSKNEAQAYANDKIPGARGDAAKLREQAEGYKASVIARAEGDAERFKSVLAEYQKAPQVTRDRIYIDTMQQIYSNVSKVMVDSRTGSNLLYLPLDKLLQQGGSGTVSVSQPQPTSLPEPTTLPSANDLRSRDNQRSRDGR
jgi:modulator of FtsH protease HflK